MDDKFLTGIVLGMLTGSVVVANSVKVRQLIKDGQQQATKKIKQLKDNQSKE